jgi:DnaJ-class molecular chaperone
MDPYTTLEVPHDATLDQIKKAYRKLALKWHPDKNDGRPDAAEMFRKVKAAYDCLIDPIKREAEDRRRAYKEQAEPATGAYASQQSRGFGQSSASRFSPWTIAIMVVALFVVLTALFSSSKNPSRPVTT